MLKELSGTRWHLAAVCRLGICEREILIDKKYTGVGAAGFWYGT